MPPVKKIFGFTKGVPLELHDMVAILLSGIGRPADKRASHTLPRLTMGAAGEAGLDISKIGNARQQDDNRVAVLDAKGLGDCWLELCAILKAAQLQSADYQADQMAMYRSMHADPDSTAGHAWIKSCLMSDKSIHTLRHAIATSDLPIWRIHDAREVPLAAVVLEREDVKYGILKSFERPEPEMQGARLWVKTADWTAFLQRTLIPDASCTLTPPDEQFVTLSEALTWIAFGVSMNSDMLHNVLSLESYGTVVPQEALKAATARLIKIANEGKVAMRGKYRASHQIRLRTLLTDAINPIKFADFRQFNYLYDELKHGHGLWAWKEPNGVSQLGNRRGGRPDSYCHVGVNRSDLLSAFPRQARRSTDESKQRDDTFDARLRNMEMWICGIRVNGFCASKPLGSCIKCYRKLSAMLTPRLG